MSPYKISASNKGKFKRAAIRLIRELILADTVIDNEELCYFEVFSQPYSSSTHLIGELDSKLYRFDIRAEDILESQSLTLSDALMTFKSLRASEMKFLGQKLKFQSIMLTIKFLLRIKFTLRKILSAH